MLAMLNVIINSSVTIEFSTEFHEKKVKYVKIFVVREIIEKIFVKKILQKN